MNIKVVIWDLDDTLWSGTLAESDQVILNVKRAHYIRKLNECGIVSSICSKNEFENAKQKLESFSLWDELVFRRIDFVPKGESVKNILDDMNLQAKHALFIDDNSLNLAEVKYLLPEINVLDASSKECDIALEKLINQSISTKKSRLEEYRILDEKITDQIKSGSDRESFLKSCEINVCLVERMDNLEFSQRIEELINRTNQLNFLKSRVVPGSINNTIINILKTECYSLFAWDKYGYHGLIGFATVESYKKLIHLTFSCRIMHMGIEEWMLDKLKSKYPNLDISNLNIYPSNSDWIHEKSYSSKPIRELIRSKEFIKFQKKPLVRIMANCQSAAFAHFLGLENIVEFDNMPRFFHLSHVYNNSYLNQDFPDLLVYAPLSDYWDAYWPSHISKLEFIDIFSKTAKIFFEFLHKNNKRILLILPPEVEDENKYHNVSKDLLISLNNILRDMSLDYEYMSVLEVSDIAFSHEIQEARHFEASLIKRISFEIKKWLDRNLNSLLIPN
jgi:FkbH-like protein